MKDHVEYHRNTDTPDLVLSEGLYSEYRFEPHYHIDYHIGLVVEGVQKQRFQGSSVLLGLGRISIMPPGEIHDGIGHEHNAYRLKTFRISPDLISGYFSEIYDTHRDPFFGGAMMENPYIANRLLQVFSAIQGGDSISTLAVEESWFKLLEPLLSDLCVLSPHENKGTLAAKHWDWVREYCHANLGDKIVLDQLAKLCGLSRYQFLRRFERTTGVTPHAWLTRLRLEHACRLMRHTDNSIAQVASDVGFYDQSHFNRAFRQAYGVSPSKY